MNSSLPISRLVNVSVSLSVQAAQAQNLSTLLILGSSTIIDVVSRMRTYNTIEQVASDFGTNAPEYLAALLWFEQNPQPTTLMIGRWAKNASSGQLFGGALAAGILATLQGIANGSVKVAVDGGAEQSLVGLNFTAITNLNGAATVINGALAGAVCTYDAVNNRFFITSNTTGAASTVAFANAGAGGTDVSNTLALRAVSAGAYVANGIVAESAVAAVTLFDTNFGQLWYAVTVLGSVTAEQLAVAAFIEAASTFHFFGVTSQNANALLPNDNTSDAYQFSQLKYKRTALAYSSTNTYAVVSLLGRILTVDYTANNSVITLMYKQEPGIVAETLNATQITALEARNCNVFVNYNNGVAIIEPGVCTSGDFIDTIIGSAAFAVGLQTALFNLLYTSPTKIPQTDAGTHLLVATIEQVASQFVSNGLLAPGVWDSAGFGALQQGQYLSKGYYVFAPPLSLQSSSSRAARISVPIQVAAKLAGAVHTVDLSVTVNN